MKNATGTICGWAIALLLLIAPSKALTQSFLEAQLEFYGLFTSGNYLKALEAGEKAYKIACDTHGYASEQVASIQRALCMTYRECGKFEQADSVLTLAGEIALQIGGKKSLPYLDYMVTLGSLKLEDGDMEGARETYLQCLELSKETSSATPVKQASICNGIGNVEKRLGNYDKAEHYLTLSLNYLIDNPNPEDPNWDFYVAGATENLLNIYMDLGDHEESVKFGEMNLEAWEKAAGNESGRYATAIGYLGNIALERGHYLEAERYYRQALDLHYKIFGKDHFSYGLDLNNLAAIYSAMGDRVKALKYLRQAKTTYAQKLGKKHHRYSKVIHNQGTLMGIIGQLDSAEILQLEALNILESNGLENENYLETLESLASLYIKRNELAKADSVLDKAELLISEKGLENSSTTGTVYFRRGKSASKRNKHHEAVRYFDKSLAVLLPSSGKNDRSWIVAGLHRALSLNLLGRLSEARVQFRESIETQTEKLAKALPELSEEEKLRYQSHSKEFMDIYMSFVLREGVDVDFTFGKYNLIRETSLQSSKWIQREVSSKNSPELKKSYEKWRSQRQMYANLLALPKEKQWTSPQLIAWQIDSLERILIKESKVFKEYVSSEEIRPSQLSQEMAQNKALVQFFHIRHHDGHQWTDSMRYGAFVVRGGRPKAALVPLFYLPRHVSGQRPSTLASAESSRGIRPSSTSGAKGYREIWKPLEAYLKGVDQVYYIPSGILNRISIPELSPQKGVYLEDRFNLEMVSSPRAIGQDDSLSAQGQALLFGGMDYNHNPTTDTSALPKRWEKWAFLGESNEEVERISKTLEDHNHSNLLLSGTAGIESRFYEEVSDRRIEILHFATHGYYLPDTTSQAIASDPLPFSLVSHPLFRSGLVLTGANATRMNSYMTSRENDGYLTAYEIAALDLSHVKLVVMSACESGLGDIHDSEGVQGLQSAFKTAGAKCILMSLSPVGDAESREFMALFYQNLMSLKSIQKAFKETQEDLHAAHPESPSSWSQWVLLH